MNGLMDVVTALMLEYQVCPMNIDLKKLRGCTPCSRVGRFISCAILVSLASGCYDTLGTALVDLHLVISLIDARNRPFSGADVWYRDHDLGWQAPRRIVSSPICTTGPSGICSTEVRYLYSVYSHSWMPRDATGYTAARRFELIAVANGRSEALGFLPRLTSAQVTGLEVVTYRATLQNL
jgi:hypothetical protein